MRAAVIVAGELLQCRLLESGREALLERVAELLDAACRGAAPFCTLPTSQAVGGRPHPRHNRAPPSRALESLSPSTSLADQPAPLRTCHLGVWLLQATSLGAVLEYRPLADRTRGRLKKAGT